MTLISRVGEYGYISDKLTFLGRKYYWIDPLGWCWWLNASRRCMAGVAGVSVGGRQGAPGLDLIAIWRCQIMRDGWLHRGWRPSVTFPCPNLVGWAPSLQKGLIWGSKRGLLPLNQLMVSMHCDNGREAVSDARRRLGGGSHGASG